MAVRITQILFLSILAMWACTDGTSGRLQAEESSFSYGLSEDTASRAKATFAGGCFWCTEAYFERLQGVSAVVSGYAGGKEKNPTYQEVSAGRTGHAEAVQVYYNPAVISYEELLEVFFATHDPTTLNRQGPDYGKQYRSVVFYRDDQEKKQVQKYIRELEEAGTYRNKIVTQVVPFTKFYKAEEYHQDYYRRNPDDPYVVQVARPKVLKFEDAFRNRLKSDLQEASQ
ncbi:peptide-methionine (S)-S-oxide reductase MsrA [Pontibacter ruber]|uniref:Peptide methionine sulfoxide reductase MsrA n=1 Tax=Pontibacter ruber TaxID=1343895 RepID=A0ABW5CTE6_9BACT|nr:peptide-methionine (S)-S-oxide reductase MsrA [Pontibacter ruber]